MSFEQFLRLHTMFMGSLKSRQCTGTHRPRVKLGVPGRSHRDLPIRAEKHRSARRCFARTRSTSSPRRTCGRTRSLRRPALSEPRISRGGGLVSPVGLIEIYPSAPRNTDPRGVPSRASGAERCHRIPWLAAPLPASLLRPIPARPVLWPPASLRKLLARHCLSRAPCFSRSTLHASEHAHR